jgi:hypothetical protein
MTRRPTRSKAAIVALGAISVVLAGLWLVAGRWFHPPAETPGDVRSSPSARVGEGPLSGDHGTGTPRPDGSSGSPSALAADGQPDAPLTEAESREAERVAEEMGRLVRDLEYSSGLPEPPQQTVQRPPEPWRPDPARQGPSPIVDSVEPRHGRAAGGDRVVLRGRNLRAVEVMFGQAAGKILSASGSTLTVETPSSGPGQVAIAVTNDDGTWAVVDGVFTFGD